MTAFQQVAVPNATYPSINPIKEGDKLTGAQLVVANLPLGSVIRYTRFSRMTWFFTRLGWMNYDGAAGPASSLDSHGEFEVIHIPIP